LAGKHLVGCIGGTNFHWAFGDELHMRGSGRGVVGKVAVEQLKVVVRPSRITDKGAIIPIYEIARVGAGAART
jgi:hypothetical protein